MTGAALIGACDIYDCSGMSSGPWQSENHMLSIGYSVNVCPGGVKPPATQLPGYTGFRDDRIDSLGQPFPLAGIASRVSNKTSIEKNGRAKLVLMASHDRGSAG